MHIVAVSAANICHARCRSTSTQVCALIRQILQEECLVDITLDIIALVDYELKPCTGCGRCFETGRCCQDTTFNNLYARMVKGDALFFVAAHYAPIPSKLCMLLEKVEQTAFLPRFHDESLHSPLYQKPAGIIGHCGGTAEMIGRGYKAMILDTIANALGWPVEMEVVGAGPDWPNGVLFPIEKVACDPASVFPIQTYHWEDVRRRITPLVLNVYQKALANGV